MAQYITPPGNNTSSVRPSPSRSDGVQLNDQTLTMQYDQWLDLTESFRQQLTDALANARCDRDRLAQIDLRKKSQQFEEFVGEKNVEIQAAFDANDIEGAQNLIYIALEHLYGQALDPNQRFETGIPVYRTPEPQGAGAIVQYRRYDDNRNSRIPVPQQTVAQIDDENMINNMLNLHPSVTLAHDNWNLMMDEHEKALTDSLAEARAQKNRKDIMVLNRKIAAFHEVIVPMKQQVRQAFEQLNLELAQDLICRTLETINGDEEVHTRVPVYRTPPTMGPHTGAIPKRQIDDGTRIPIYQMKSYNADENRFAGATITAQGPVTTLSQVDVQAGPSQQSFRFRERTRQSLPAAAAAPSLTDRRAFVNDQIRRHKTRQNQPKPPPSVVPLPLTVEEQQRLRDKRSEFDQKYTQKMLAAQAIGAVKKLILDVQQMPRLPNPVQQRLLNDELKQLLAQAHSAKTDMPSAAQGIADNVMERVAELENTIKEVTLLSNVNVQPPTQMLQTQSGEAENTDLETYGLPRVTAAHLQAMHQRGAMNNDRRRERLNIVPNDTSKIICYDIYTYLILLFSRAKTKDKNKWSIKYVK